MSARLETAKENISTPAETRFTAPACIRILLVDDDIYIQELNTGALIRAGYDVETADDGAEAWQILNSRSSHFDLLITDNTMPRITGLKLIQKLRSAGMTLPVILTPEIMPVEGFEPRLCLPFNATLPKPFTTTELLNTVGKVLRAVNNTADDSRLSGHSHSKDNNAPTTGQKGASRQIQTEFSRRVLVVDDEPLIRQLCTELLNDHGYEVEAAKNGADAWVALQMNGYDLLITDNEMPQLSGIELVKKLRAARMVVPVILVSGMMPVEELKQHPELHIDAALLKPFNIQDFADIVKKFSGRRAARLATPDFLGIRPRQTIRFHTLKTPPMELLESGQIRPIAFSWWDDDSDTRQISINVLADSGYNVEGAIDGVAGWDALRVAEYDLVVTDNKMPRMTGLKMLEKIHAARMSLPVIMATGNLPLHEFESGPGLNPMPCCKDHFRMKICWRR
ncbi:MAG: response regulator [Limisphaerales bacterium]